MTCREKVQEDGITLQSECCRPVLQCLFFLAHEGSSDLFSQTGYLKGSCSNGEYLQTSSPTFNSEKWHIVEIQSKTSISLAIFRLHLSSNQDINSRHIWCYIWFMWSEGILRPQGSHFTVVLSCLKAYKSMPWLSSSMCAWLSCPEKSRHRNRRALTPMLNWKGGLRSWKHSLSYISDKDTTALKSFLVVGKTEKWI